MKESTIKILSQVAKNAAVTNGRKDVLEKNSLVKYSSPENAGKIYASSAPTLPSNKQAIVPAEAPKPVSAGSALAGMQTGTDAKSVLAGLLASGDTLAYGAAKAEFDAQAAAEKAKREAASKNPYGGAQALADTLQSRSNVLAQRAANIESAKANLESRIAAYKAGKGTDTEESLNREMAVLTMRTNNYNKDLEAFQAEYGEMSGIIAKGIADIDRDIAKKNHAVEVYYSDEHGEMLQRQIDDAYNRQMVQAAAERDGITTPSAKNATELWEDYQAARGRYTAWETERAYHDISQVDKVGQMLLTDYVEAKNGQSTSNGNGKKGGYYNTEEVQKRLKAVVDHFGAAEAERLIQIRDRVFNAEKGAKEQQAMQEYASRGVGEAIAASVASIVTNALSGIPAIVSTIGQKIHNPAGFNTLDTNTAGFSMLNATESLRGGVQNAIMADPENATFGQKAGVIAYSTLMSGIDSYLASYLPGGMGGAALAMNAAASTIKDVTARGGSIDQAIVGGLAAGVFEALFENVSIGNLKAMRAADVTKNMKDVALNIAKSAIVNASEEGATEIANILFDTIALGDVSNYQQRLRELMADGTPESEAKLKLAGELGAQVGESALSGLLMGIAFGGIESVAGLQDYKRRMKANTNIAETLNELAAVKDVGYIQVNPDTAELEFIEGVKPAELKLSEMGVSDETIAQAKNTLADIYKAYGENADAMVQQEIVNLQNDGNRSAAVAMAALYEQEQGDSATGTENASQDNTEAETVMRPAEQPVQERVEAQRVTTPAAQEEATELWNVIRESYPAGAMRDAIAMQEVSRQANSGNGDIAVALEDMWRSDPGTVAPEARIAPVAQAAQMRQTAVAENVNAGYNGENIIGGAEYGEEVEETGRTGNLPDGSSERDARESTGRPAGSMAKRTGRNSARYIQTRRAIDRQNRVNDLRIEKVSSESLGISNGTAEEIVTVIPDELMDSEMTETRERIERLTGKTVTFITGRLRLNTNNGVKYAQGAITSDHIIVQADNLKYSVRQIAEHELFHDLVRGNRGMVDAIRTHILENFDRDAFEKVVKRYEEAYAGVYTGSDLQNKIIEEIFADAYAGMNSFSDANVEPYSEDIRAIADRRTGNTARAEMSERETRAGPEDAGFWEDGITRYSLREEAPPKKTGIAYKVFLAKDGGLYPPMVANPNGEATPVGVWLNADIGQSAPPSKTGRAQVQGGGKGTNSGKISLAFRPGWHLGDIPLAKQFAKLNPATGQKELFPANFVWAECEYAMDVDYQEEAMSYGYTENGKFRHSYAGLPRLPEDGYYRYRTNPNPDTVPWVITGAMKVTRILTDEETDAICRKNGVEPMARQGGPIDLEKFGLKAGETEPLTNQFIRDDAGNESAMFSLSTYDEEGREYLRNWLDESVRSGDISEKDASDIEESLEYVYNVCNEYRDKYAPFGEWSDAKVVRGEDGRPIMSVVKANGEYALNLDFSLVCKKRRALDTVINEMVRRGIVNGEMGPEQIVSINQVIKEHGFEIACDLCFVDAKRYRQAGVADQFVNLWNKAVKSLAKSGQAIDTFDFGGDETITHVENGIDTLQDSDLDMTSLDRDIAKYSSGKVERKIAEYLKAHPEDRKLLTRGSFMATQGFENVLKNKPGILSLYNSKKGSGGPKAAFPDVQYLSDILKDKKFNADAAYVVGGVRLQSFSDFVPRMVFDYMQMVADLAAKKLPAHAYTKEEAFVRIFGKTGIKINMSLIPRFVEGGVAPGLDENGNYAWADESFDYDTAVKLQNEEGYSQNVGTIAVGVSVPHILKLLRDPNVRMVIPYHKSGINPKVAVKLLIKEYQDATKVQYTRYADKRKLSKADQASEPNFNERLHELGANADPRAVAQEYLDWCDANGYLPKFDEFRNEENYYKLLEDFTVYDANGNYAPQGAVRFEMPDNVAELISDALSSDADTQARLTNEASGIVDEIEQRLQGDVESFSISDDAEYMDASDRDTDEGNLTPEVDSDGNELSDGQEEYFRYSKVRDENGHLLVMYHGTNSDNAFTVFNTYGGKFGLFGMGSYFTDNRNVAESYTKKGKGNNPRVYQVYLNAKNSLDMDAIGNRSAWTKAVKGADFANCETNEDYFRALKEYCMDEEMVRWEAEEFITDVILGMGFDSITHVGGGRYGSKDGPSHQVYIVFEPEQIKNTDNRTPTGDADIRYSVSESDEESPTAEAEQIWNELQNTHTNDAMRDAMAAKEVGLLRDRGDTETADVLERLWHADPRTVAPPTGYDDRGERWDGTMRTAGEQTDEAEPQEPNRFEQLRRRAMAPKEERLRLVTREEFSATPAIDKLGIRIEGSVADYAGAESLRRNESAAREMRRDIEREKRRMHATAAEDRIAAGVAAGILTEDDIPNSMDPDRIMDLAELLNNERALGFSMIRDRKRTINEELDQVMDKLFHDAEKYKPVSEMSFSHNTMQRNMTSIFGDSLGKKINHEIFDPVAKNEAERIRFVNRQFDDVRAFEDSKGRMKQLSKKDSALVQQIIEGRAIAEQVAAMEMSEAIREAAEDIRNGGKLEDTAIEHHLGRGDALTAQRYARWMETQETLKNGKYDTVKIENAVKAYQQKYAEYYDAINDFLVVHGYEPIGFIKGYAPHMQPDESKNLLNKALQALGIQTEVSNLPTSIAGLTSEFKPGKRWNPYFLERTTDQTEFDVQAGFESYISFMSDIFFHTDDIMRVRRMVNYFRKTFSRDEIRNQIEWAEDLRYAPIEDKEAFLREHGKIQSGTYLTRNDVEKAMDDFIDEEYGHIEHLTKFGGMVASLDNYANLLAGKQDIADRGSEIKWGRKSLNTGLKLARVFSKAQVAGNISSAFNQTSQLPMIVAENGLWNTLRSMKDFASGKLHRAGFSRESDLLTGKRGIKFLINTPGDMVTTVLFKPAEFVDGLLSTLAVRGAYYKALKKGLKHEDAIRAADQYGNEVMASRLKGVRPTAFEEKNPLSQMINMFQIEAINSWEHIIKDLPRDFREIAETKGRGKAALALAGVIVKALLGAFVLNRISDEIYGGTPAPFDLIGLSANFVASGNGISTNDYVRIMIDNVWEKYTGERYFETERPEEKDEFDWESATKDLAYNVSNDIPFLRNVSGLMGWGDQTIPMPNIYGKGAALKDAIANSGFRSEETGEAAVGLLSEIMPGGRQLYKTTQGVKTMLNEGRYKGYGENERLQYPVADSWQNWLRAVAFGNTALPETNSFYASGLDGLAKGQTAVYRQMVKDGADGGEVYETIQEIRAAEKPREKRDIITASDLTDKQKAQLYSGIISDSRDDDFAELMRTGMSWEKMMDAYNTYSDLNAEEKMTATEKATEFAKWLDGQTYNEKQNAMLADKFVFYSMAPAEADRYNKLTDAGLSNDAAYKLTGALSALTPEDGKKQVTEMQKYREIAKGSLSDESKIVAIGTVMGTEMETESGNPSQYAKMLAALDEGAGIDEYLDLLEVDGVDLYLEATDAGIGSANAIAISQAVKAIPKHQDGTNITRVERQTVAVKSISNVQDQIKAYAILEDEKDYEKAVAKLTALNKDYSIKPDKYIEYKKVTGGLDAKDASGETVPNLKKARVLMAINNMSGLTKAQKDALYLDAGYTKKEIGKALWNSGRKYSSAEEYAKYL